MKHLPSSSNARCLTIRQQEIWLCGVTALLILLQPGCSWLRNAFYRGQSPPSIFNQQVTKEQIIEAVNANSQAIRSLQATVHASATGSPTLSGELFVEQPSRLRMQVGLLNMNNSGIDVGSNDNEFWVWIKSAIPGGPPPAVLYATHAEYERSATKQAIPIEPSWVIDSLGLAYFDPRVQHDGPYQRPDGMLEIRSTYQSSTGQMVKSTMVHPQSSVVVAQELYRNGVKVASSQASKHQYFQDINASIPRFVEIEVGLNTPQPGKVKIELSGILPNSIDAAYSGIWEMPRPKNIEMINIARQGLQPPGSPTAPSNSPYPNSTVPNALGSRNPVNSDPGVGSTGVPRNPVNNSPPSYRGNFYQEQQRQSYNSPRGFGPTSR